MNKLNKGKIELESSKNEDISFHIQDIEILRFKENGDIVIHGKTYTQNDVDKEMVKKIIEAFTEFFKKSCLEVIK